MSNKHMKEITDTRTLTISSKKTKDLGIKQTKEVQDL